MDFTSNVVPLLSYLYTQMQIGVVFPILDTPLQPTLFFLERIQLVGAPTSNALLPDLQQKQNTGL
ncbi:hypothetical protein MTR67_041714 [Solanum verrucosum]|uniref:Uncharacterized protein n=1 Tax=Solanum verrucosum TaxID=315347 RepID=A0AAF0UNE3_SOLVR|nr:hypothetical protein MTR67_041714 [Solanum verrucosum]